MTKELSKQICKICGIKPETITVNRSFTKIEVEAYPDFGEPENFCKLADLSIEAMYNKKIFWLVSEESLCEDREDFLGKFYEILKKADLPDYYLEPIKQAIRKEEWRYV